MKIILLPHFTAKAGEDVTFSGYNDRQANWAQMKRPMMFKHFFDLFFVHCRQLDNADTYNIPNEIVESWKQAVQSRSRAAKNAVFQAFLKAGKDWSKLLGHHDEPQQCTIYRIYSLGLYQKSQCECFMCFSPVKPNVAWSELRLSVRCSRSRTDRTIGRTKHGPNLR